MIPIGMNWLDCVFICIVLASTVFGIVKGLIRELLSLAFFVIAVLLSFLFFRDLGERLSKSIRNPEIANIVGFGLIFLSVLLIGAVVTWAARKIFSVGPLKAMDRILGGAFGMLRGVLISGIIVFLMVVFPINEKVTRESRLSPYMLHTFNLILKVVPGNYREQIHRFIKQENGQKNT